MIYGNYVTPCEKVYVTPQKETRKQKGDAGVREENCLQHLNGKACVTASIHRILMQPLQATVSLPITEVSRTYQNIRIKIRIICHSLTPWNKFSDNQQPRGQSKNVSFIESSGSHYCVHKSPTLILSPIENYHVLQIHFNITLLSKLQSLSFQFYLLQFCRHNACPMLYIHELRNNKIKFSCSGHLNLIQNKLCF